MRVDQSKFPKVPLPKLVEINVGKTPPRKDSDNFGGGYPWISISDMKGSKYISKTRETLSEKGLVVSNIKPVLPNTLLFSFKLSIGKVSITKKEMFTNEAIAAFPIKDHDKLDLNYFYYVMSCFNFSDGGVRAVMGKTLNKAKLQRLKIPLPPLPIQRKIADILDAADTYRQKTKLLIEKYDELAQSLFLDMFGDPVRNEKGWEVFKLSEIAADDCPVTYGIVQPGREYDNGIPIVRPVDLFKRVIYRDGLKLIDPEISNSYKRTILKGDEILISVRGTTGIVSLASKELNGANVSRGIAPLWFKPTIKKIFALNLLKTVSINRKIQENTYGATLKQINLSELRRLPLIAPPIELQTEYELRTVSINNQKNLLVDALIKSDKLFQCLLQMAFKGELVKDVNSIK